MIKTKGLNPKKRKKVINSGFKKIKKYGIFNSILSDGEHLFCYGDSNLYYLEKRFKTKKPLLKEIKDGKIRLKHPVEKTILISTRPLTKDKWTKIKGLKVFKDGEFV